MKSKLTQHTETIWRKLLEIYPEAKCELNYSNALELLIATVMSAQSTDVQINKITEKLFKKYKKAEDYLNVPVEELEKDIHSSGFYRAKTKAIRALCERIIEHYQGEVPDTMKELTTLRGVARKTASIVLWNIFRKNEGLAVDTHVMRLSKRMGLTRHDRLQSKIEQDLMKLIPNEYWGIFSHALVLHGRYICKAQKPRCSHCPLKDICPKIGIKNKKIAGSE